MKTQQGYIESVWRYPVKSLIGESLDAIEIDKRGIVGDRLYAISNAHGKFGSGKNTRRFRRIDGLFSIAASVTRKGLLITFPDGSTCLSDDASLNRELSDTLGQKVTLTKEAGIPHFDDGAIHIITTASLSLLRENSPQLDITAERFRPNIVIQSTLLDEDLLNRVIRIGPVSMRVSRKTKRCRMIALEQAGMPKQAKILRSVSRQFGLHFGVYAEVISGGAVSVGEAFSVSEV